MTSSSASPAGTRGGISTGATTSSSPAASDVGDGIFAGNTGISVAVGDEGARREGTRTVAIAAGRGPSTMGDVGEGTSVGTGISAGEVGAGREGTPGLPRGGGITAVCSSTVGDIGAGEVRAPTSVGTGTSVGESGAAPGAPAALAASGGGIPMVGELGAREVRASDPGCRGGIMMSSSSMAATEVGDTRTAAACGISEGEVRVVAKPPEGTLRCGGAMSAGPSIGAGGDVGAGRSVGTGTSLGEVGPPGAAEAIGAEPKAADAKCAVTGRGWRTTSSSSLARDVGDGRTAGTTSGISVGESTDWAPPDGSPGCCGGATSWLSSCVRGTGEVGAGLSVGTGTSVGEVGAARTAEGILPAGGGGIPIVGDVGARAVPSVVGARGGMMS